MNPRFPLQRVVPAAMLAAAFTAHAQTASKAEAAQDETAGKYEALAEGVYTTRILSSFAHRDVRVEIWETILGAGKSAPDIPTRGVQVTELRAGEVETKVDGQAVHRKPGDFWVVREDQTYQVRNLAGMAVLHNVVFTKK